MMNEITENVPEIKSGYIPSPATAGNFTESGQRNSEGYQSWSKEYYQEYIGSFVNDNLHGYGKYIHLDGSKSYMYDGTVYANNFEGYSNITYFNGDYFEGLFKQNKRFGPGVYTYANGSQNVGLWYGTQLIRLSTVVMGEWVPKLAISTTAKTKLLKYRKLVPILQEYKDAAKDILVKLNARPEVVVASSRLYNSYVRNLNSLFFDRRGYDEKFFGEIDCTIDVVNKDDDFLPTMSSLSQFTTTKEDDDAPEDIVADLLNYLLENVNIVEDFAEEERKSFVYESILEARRRLQIKYDPTNILIENILGTFMEELDSLLSEPKLKRTLLINKKVIQKLLPQDHKLKMDINFRKVVVTDLLAWNNDELSIEILKHVFTHRNREDSTSFSIPKLLSGDRGKFNTPGELERKCIQFLTYCSSGNVNEALKIFKENKLNPDLCDARGNSGIIFASARDMWRVIRVLCDFGANLDLVNDECLTGLTISLLRYIAIENNIKDWQRAFIPDAVISQEEELQIKHWHPHVSLTNINLLSTMSLVEPYNMSQENELPMENYNRIETALKAVMSDGEITHTAMYKELTNIEIGMVFKNFQEPYSQSMDSKQDYIFNVKCLPQFKNTVTKSKDRIMKKGKQKVGIYNLRSKIKCNSGDNDEFIKDNKLKVVLKTISVLLSCGANPNLSLVPLPALHLAIFCKNATLFELLLKSNANPDITTEDEGLSPLHILAALPFSHDNLEMLHILLQNGANPNIRTNTYHWMKEKQKILGKQKYNVEDLGKTPLHILSMRYDYESNEAIQINMVKLLLSNGADINESYLEHDGFTLAVLRGNTSLIKFYLECGNVNPYKKLGGNMGVLTTILVSKRYADILSLEKSRKVYELLAVENVNPLVEVEGYGNAIEFMEREYNVEDSGGGYRGEVGEKQSKNTFSTISGRIKPKPKVKFPPKQGTSKFLMELTRRMLERHIQYQAFRYLQLFIMHNVDVEDELMTALVTFLPLKDMVTLLQLLIHRGIIKPNPSGFYLVFAMLELSKRYDKIKAKKGKSGDDAPLEIIKKFDWSEEKRTTRYHTVEPELDTDVEKFKVCFYCLRKSNKDLILCPTCGLVYFCCQECNRLSIKQPSIHKCKILFYDAQKEIRDSALANNLEYVESKLHRLLRELNESLRKKYETLIPNIDIYGDMGADNIDFSKFGSFIHDQMSQNPDLIRSMNEVLEKNNLVDRKEDEGQDDYYKRKEGNEKNVSAEKEDISGKEDIHRKKDLHREEDIHKKKDIHTKQDIHRKKTNKGSERSTTPREGRGRKEEQQKGGTGSEKLSDVRKSAKQRKSNEYKDHPASAQNIKCEQFFVETTTRDKMGKFVVAIPFKHTPDVLGESEGMATRRLSTLERRLEKQPRLMHHYKMFMEEYQQLGHMSKLQSESYSNYLPHHGVCRADNLTTKLRVVFDGSAATSNGISFNDIQYTGPNIQQELISILIRFTSDVAKMYRQILITEMDRKFQ
ncbi:hypothetical protein Trydic_g9178 [Trypoxylus dichotomus]